MKTILYLIPHLEKSGPVTQLYGMINHLDPSKYRAIILSFFKERPNSFQQMFEEHGAKVINGNLNRWQLLQQKAMLKRVIDEEIIDIVHSCSIITDGICSGLNLHVPLVLTIHCFIYEDVITRYGNILGHFLCMREKRAIKKASVVITVSRSLAEKYSEKINKKFLPIPNGIETSCWEPDEGMTEEKLKKKLDLPCNTYIVLSTNYLDAIKDPLLLIRAFKEANIPNSLLVMLGDGDMRDECRKYEEETIVFTGRVNNVKDYLYASSVLVSASKSEGMPYAILEAKCTGIPMILSDIPQHREIVQESTDVLFFPVGDKSCLVELLKRQIKDRIQYDMTMYSAAYMSKQYQKVYSTLH